MGVNGLWDVISDVKTSKNLVDLKNEILAVDLAAWICEAETVRPLKANVLKPYLRNLFFRVLKLTRIGVKLVFVIDGKPPELKWKTIADRLETRSSNSHQQKRVAPNGSRRGLNAKFNECCNLLSMLGIPWLKSDGEAEATCAALNAAGMVDACVTNDGDAFLYGAQKVYRNMRICNKKDTIIESYEMKDIEKQLQLSRNSLIAFALLLGCDYAPQGVLGVGKVQAIKLLSKWKNENPLAKLKECKAYHVITSDMDRPVHCSSCKHKGTKSEHAKVGCKTCKFNCVYGSKIFLECSCDWHFKQNMRKDSAIEDGVMRKVSVITDFPNQAIIDEFQRERNPELHYKQDRPSLERIVQYLQDKLEWPEEYALEKTLPLLTYWTLHHAHKETNISLKCVKRTRIRDGVAVFEVEWCVPKFGERTTIEPQSLVQLRFPQYYQEFYAKLNDDKAVKKMKKKIQAKPSAKKASEFYKSSKESIPTTNPIIDVDAVTSSLQAIGLSEISQKGNTREWVGAEPSCSRKISTPTNKDDEHRETEHHLEKSWKTVTPHNFVDLTQTDQSTVEKKVLQDISFEINFSLGQSLLNTPPLQSCMRNSLSEQHIAGTPKKTVTTVNEISDSPVFMSLFERVRLKNQK